MIKTSDGPAILSRLFSLEGRTAVVTGATSGIGHIIASALVQAGAKTFVVARKAAQCEQVAQALSGLGDCRALPGDVSTRAGCAAIAEGFRGSESRLHVLVNAAGTTWGARLDEYPDSAWDKVLAVNLKSVFHLTVALLPQLEAAGTDDDPAKVINIGSVHGFVAPEWETYAYAASKAGVHHLTRHLAKHIGRRHVVVNAIAPGPFQSRMMAAILEKESEALTRQTATGRLGRDDDMAGIAIYLASRASAHVTGAVIPVDGGYGTTR